MNILIATDSFKGSLTSRQAAEAIELGIKRACASADCTKIPVADGGEGTLDAIMNVIGGELRYQTVVGPMGEPVQAAYLMLPEGETAVVEMAAASGLALVKQGSRDPVRGTSYGTGELIRSALDAGARKIICGLGGSATVDGGMGMVQALGYQFYDAQGLLIAPPGCGGLLPRVASVGLSDVASQLAECEIVAACDVKNPLSGEQGAVPVYGPQKGATPETVKKLQSHLKHYCGIVEQSFGKNAQYDQGAGAAGGLGFALKLFAGAKLVSGFGLIAEMIGLESRIAQADLVITGEGRVDTQTVSGKAPAGVAEIAQRHGVPVVAIGGSLTPESRQLFRLGFSGLESSVTEVTTEDQQLRFADANLSYAAERVMRLLLLGQRLASR